MTDPSSRVAQELFVITHYNLLAQAYGENTKPWFLYGAKPPVSKRERDAIEEKYNLRNAEGKPLHPGFRSYTSGILSERRMEQIEAYDREHFAWESRKWRVLDTILERQPDIVTLAECDNYEGFFKEQLFKKGNLRSRWVRRPRREDGSCIAWRDSRYELLQEKSVVFTEMSKSGETRVDTRAALLVYLKERKTDKKMAVITTHLAKFPEDEDLEWSRAREVIQLGIALYEFFKENCIPISTAIVLGGDLNCLDMKRLTSIGNVICWLCYTRGHNFFYNPIIIHTEATSKTLMRDVQIDYIAYAKGSLFLHRLHRIPPSKSPMPNAQFPSDHHPVSVTFVHHGIDRFNQFSGQRYLENIYSHMQGGKMEHLSVDELLAAHQYICDVRQNTVRKSFDLHGYRFVDMCRSIKLPVSEMLTFFEDVIATLYEGGAKPAALSASVRRFRKVRRGRELVSFQRLSEIYYHLEFKDDVPDKKVYDDVFDFLDVDHSQSLDPDEVRQAIEKISGREVDEQRYTEVMGELDTDSDGLVTREEFMAWVIGVHKKMHFLRLHEIGISREQQATGSSL